MMADMLALSTDLPEVTLTEGEVLVLEGNLSGPIWVLVDGVLTVSRGGIEVTTISLPGSVIGEVSVLLGVHHGSTVVVSTGARLRLAEDGAAFLGREPAILRLVAEGMARRLNLVTSYLVDLKDQYGDAPGISMVAEVLSTLGHHGHDGDHGQPMARSGSARDPEPKY